jgi:ankyrin repeat protein
MFKRAVRFFSHASNLIASRERNNELKRTLTYGSHDSFNRVLVQTLRDNALDISECLSGLIHIAVTHEDSSRLPLLLDAGAAVNERDERGFYDGNGPSALFYAAMYGKQDAAERLVKANADVNMLVTLKPATDQYFRHYQHLIAMHLAARNGDVPMLELLYNAGSTINSCNANDETPYHFADLWQRKRAAEILRYWGAVPRDGLAKSNYRR